MDSRTISAIAGAAGAAALTLLDQAGRQLFEDAPRMDVLGERTIAAARQHLGMADASTAELHREALAGDLVSHAMYFAMVGTGTSAQVWGRGLTLGLVAGVGALTLPPQLGLGDPPSMESPRTRALTLAYFLAGGLVAAAVSDNLQRRH